MPFRLNQATGNEEGAKEYIYIQSINKELRLTLPYSLAYCAYLKTETNATYTLSVFRGAYLFPRNGATGNRLTILFLILICLFNNEVQHWYLCKPDTPWG